MHDETQVISDETQSSDAKLVPVSESIRYRKRAQSAEKQLEELQEKLQQAEDEKKNLAEKLGAIESESRLTKALGDFGAKDVEAAMLVVKSRLAKNPDGDIKEIIETLKREKSFLFHEENDSTAKAMAEKTSGAKHKISAAAAHLNRKANAAMQSGSRADVMEYLRARRQYKI